MTHLAYLHGFASNPRTKKGRVIADAFAEKLGRTMDIPDLNQPSFDKLTLSAQLDEVTRWAADKERVSFVGSSMGGWVASRFAELNPSKIERLVLLAPGFDMVTRWPQIIGAQGMAAWRAHGALPFPDGDRQPVPVHWGFIEDALLHPTTPRPAVPTLVIHGIRDAIVPIDISRRWVQAHPSARLIELDDGHELMESLPTVVEHCLAFLA